MLYLTNTSSSFVSTAGDFYASKPYIIFTLCIGSGKVMVLLDPGGTSTFLCSQPTQLQGNHYGDAQHPPTPEHIHVQVTQEGNITCEVSIQLQE